MRLSQSEPLHDVDVAHGSGYEKIKSCELNNPKFRSRQVMQLPFILFDWDSVVKIQQGIKTFYIPVENAEEFVAEVNRRTEAISTENDSLC